MAKPLCLVCRANRAWRARTSPATPSFRNSYGFNELFIALLSASILLASPNTASRSNTSHGPCGSLNVAPKFLAKGVWPFFATELNNTRRGSDALYLLLARSGRDSTLPPLGDDVDLGVVAFHPGQEVPGGVGELAIAGHADRVATDERRRPALDAGDRSNADIRVGEGGVGHALQACRHWHDANLSLGETTGPGRSGL